MKLLLKLQAFKGLGQVLALASMTLVSCSLPQDVTISSPITSGSDGTQVSYTGFKGITEANTTSATKIQIKWNASTDPKVVAYNIYDSTNFFNPTLLKTVLAPATTYTITGLTTGHLYTFSVKALNSEQIEDTNTAVAQAIPYGGVISASVTSSSTANLTFNDISDADAANVYCKTGSSSTYLLAKTISTTVGITSSELTGLVSGTTYTCRVAMVFNGFIDNNTATVSFTPIGQATHIVFASQPGSSTAGTAFTPQPVIRILDANNNVITAGPDSTVLVTLSLSTNSPTQGTLRGTATVAAIGGVATFSGLNFQEAGLKILKAVKTSTQGQTYGSGELTSESNSFMISGGSVSPINSSITLTPASAPGSYLVANGSASYTVNINLKDQYQNPVAGVKPQFTSTNAGDSLSQPTSVTDSSGISTGSISTTLAGLRTLSISSPAGLTTDTVVARFIPGVATKVAFLQQPLNSPSGPAGLNQIQVAIQDAQGNTVDTSTASVSLSINNNTTNANLTGTLSVAAIAGIATFTGLGIDKTGTSYKLIANSAPLAVAYSNSFAITSGSPAKLVFTAGPSSMVSGTCTAAQMYSLQFQDIGGNPANATASTTIQLGGAGAGAFYSSCAAGATPITTLVFSTGSNLKTFYYRNNKAQSVTLTATDPGIVMAQGTLAVAVTPSQVSLSGPTSIVSGRCSSAFTITTQGADNSTGPVVAATSFSLSGQLAHASFYNDSNCSSPIDNLSAVSVQAGQSSKLIYLKDDWAESITVSVADPAGIISASTPALTIPILASKIEFTGPNTVVSGQKATYTLKIKDAANNEVNVTSANGTPLTINGLSGKQGKFYSNSSATIPAGTSVTVPQGSAAVQIYFKDLSAELLSITISDPAQVLSTSAPLSINVSPSAFAITGPSPASANTSVCAGPISVSLIDGASSVANAVTPITANLSNAGSSGAFYSDSACTTPITQLTYSSGESSKQIYHLSHYPEASLSFTASDSASPAVLSPGSFNWSVTAAPAWIGTNSGIGGGGQATAAAGSPFIWQTGKTAVASRLDGFVGTNKIKFSQDKKFIYAVDYNNKRLLKYDYQNSQYIGWVGGFQKLGGLTPTGANVFALSTTLDADGNALGASTANSLSFNCVSLNTQSTTPGWCQGGQDWTTGITSQSNWNANISQTGTLYQPAAVTDDGTYVYVLNGNGAVNRYVAATGKWTGWTGRVNATSGLAPGYDYKGIALTTSSTCSSTTAGRQTPGWCVGGGSFAGQIQRNGDSGPYSSTYWGGTGSKPMGGSIAYAKEGNDGTGQGYIYVGGVGMVGRYNADTGAFAGWIGRIESKSTWDYSVLPLLYLDQAPGTSNACASAAEGAQTPGWCINGQASYTLNTTSGGIVTATGIFVKNNVLYVATDSTNGTIARYNQTTGAFIDNVFPNAANLNSNSSIPAIRDLDFDGTYFYIADASGRIVKLDTSGSIVGWIGKVSSVPSQNGIGNTVGTCSSTSVNANTPGWCVGGSAKYGMDEGAFWKPSGVSYDGSGSIITGFNNEVPAVKKFNATTGVYEGMLANTSNSPTTWSTSQSFSGSQGYDDHSLYSPSGMYSDGSSLFVTEVNGSRIHKFDVKTGTSTGWVGAIGGWINGVTHSVGCGLYAIGVSTGWCSGALGAPAFTAGSLSPTTTNGFLTNPSGIAGDSTYIYATDYGQHRVVRFRKDDGTYAGWIGGIPNDSTKATTGPATPSDSSLCTNAYNKFTPGWCLGGSTDSSTVKDGYLLNPIAITANGGFLFVADYRHRISKYNAVTGEFLGWIGRVSSSTGLIPAYVSKVYGGSTYNYTNGWSTGGTPVRSDYHDAGGGFYFYWNRGGITSDGTNLYISNTVNSRIDVFNQATGQYVKSTKVIYNLHSNTWTTTPTSWGWLSYGSTALVYDSGYLYYTFTNTAFNTPVVAKLDVSTGSVVGWRGGIATSLTGPLGSGCVGATGVTPAWCQGGSAQAGYQLGDSDHNGGFSSPYGIATDANFVYVSDEDLHRVIRYPK